MGKRDKEAVRVTVVRSGEGEEEEEKEEEASV